MSRPIHIDLIAEIEAYCRAHELSVSGFGQRMMNDPRLVHDLRSGRELRRTTERELRAKMQMPPPPKPQPREAAE